MKQSKKEVVDTETMVKSFLNLREELSKNVDSKSREVVFKINSCLFSEYPHKYKTEKIHLVYGDRLIEKI